ncbi:hypothetical protein LTR56_023094 [Elasticomyces elasticus]|nr:hypothetical protein LTR56_023094 [Elasticomyces elasticus]KAK3639663.1 hypothetical protein LTR22_017336 [Elasticomyces elasticus]KAK4913441.1 hypothetical protein LTR49_018237 [Elasticomyces elasticus]KAK5760988.1 hypothetical protein LTS12_008836 [Elasticomyces elasticus]
MAPNFFDLPCEIRDQIYTFYFAAYASCPHGGCLQMPVKPLASEKAWCPAFEEMRAFSKACTKKEIEAKLGDCLGSHHPTGLLLASKTTYHEAAEFFLQELPLRFKFPEPEMEHLLLRWQHASPVKNVRNVILDWQCYFEAIRTVSLLGSVLRNVERVEFRADSHCPWWMYERVKWNLRKFKGLREVVFRAPIIMNLDVPVTRLWFCWNLM